MIQTQYRVSFEIVCHWLCQCFRNALAEPVAHINRNLTEHYECFKSFTPAMSFATWRLELLARVSTLFGGPHDHILRTSLSKFSEGNTLRLDVRL